MSRTKRRYRITPHKLVCRMIDGEIHMQFSHSNDWIRPLWYGDRAMNCETSEEFVKFYISLQTRDGYSSPRDNSKYWNRFDNRRYRHKQNNIVRQAVMEDPDTVGCKYRHEDQIYFNVW